MTSNQSSHDSQCLSTAWQSSYFIQGYILTLLILQKQIFGYTYYTHSCIHIQLYKHQNNYVHLENIIAYHTLHDLSLCIMHSQVFKISKRGQQCKLKS